MFDVLFAVELLLRYVAMCAPLERSSAQKRRIKLLAWNLLDTFALTSFVFSYVGDHKVEELEFFSTLR